MSKYIAIMFDLELDVTYPTFSAPDRETAVAAAQMLADETERNLVDIMSTDEMLQLAQHADIERPDYEASY